MSFELENTEDALEKLNKDFHSKRAFSKQSRNEIYYQLEILFEIDIAESVLISWLPEEDGITSISLLDQSKNICFIEIFEDYRDESTCESSTIEEYVATDFYKQYKDSHPIVTAINSLT